MKLRRPTLQRLKNAIAHLRPAPHTKGAFDYSTELSASQIDTLFHRKVVGGQWEKLGKFQLEMLLSEGLTSTSTLLDIGCGALRGGLHIIPYLTNGYYLGIDSNQSLLRAGQRELCSINHNYNNYQLHYSNDFSLPLDQPRARFKFILAFSLFTHLPITTIDQCLTKCAGYIDSKGKIVSTFFIVDEAKLYSPAIHDNGTLISYPDRDPYHFTFGAIHQLAKQLGLQIRLCPEYQHPRGQTVIVFQRKSP